MRAEERLAGGGAAGRDALGVMQKKIKTQALELQQAQAQIEALRAQLASRVR